MEIVLSLLLIVWGLSLMAFGLLLFYTLLPLWYGLFGGLLGFFLGTWLTGGGNGWFGSLIVWLIVLLAAFVFAGAAYQLEPFRRVLAGLLMGFSFGSLVALLFGGAMFLTIIFGVVGALIFAVLVPLFFDPMIVAGSSFSGAALVMDGLYLLLPALGFFLDRTNAANNGNFAAILVWIVLGAVGYFGKSLGSLLIIIATSAAGAFLVLYSLAMLFAGQIAVDATPPELLGTSLALTLFLVVAVISALAQRQNAATLARFTD